MEMENHRKEFRPRWQPVKSGVKAEIKERIRSSHLWSGPQHLCVCAQLLCPRLPGGERAVPVLAPTQLAEHPSSATLKTVFSEKQTSQSVPSSKKKRELLEGSGGWEGYVQIKQKGIGRADK